MSEPQLDSESSLERPNLWKMLVLAAPLMVIQGNVVVMQLVDGLMVGKLGSAPLAALFPAAMVYFVPMSFAWGAVTSVNTFVSQCLGKDWKEGCGLYAWQAMVLMVGYGFVYSLVAWPLAEWTFRWFGHEAEVQVMEVAYYRWSLLGAVPALVAQVCSNFFMGIHRPGVLGVSAAVATVVNIGLNWILIFGNLGAPAMGIAGAALATALSTGLQAVWLLVWFLHPKIAREYGTWKPMPTPRGMWGIIKVGVPAGFQLFFDLLSWGIGLVWLVGLFGTAHLAATSIITRWMHLSFMPTVGLGIVLTALVGKAIGAGDKELADGHTRLGMWAGVVYMGTMGVLFWMFQDWAIGIFTSDPAVIAIARKLIILMVVFQVCDAIGIMYIHALRGAGDTTVPALITGSLCLIVFLGGGLAVVNYLPQLQSIGPWAMGTLHLLLLGVLTWARWNWGPWRHMDLFRH